MLRSRFLNRSTLKSLRFGTQAGVRFFEDAGDPVRKTARKMTLCLGLLLWTLTSGAFAEDRYDQVVSFRQGVRLTKQAFQPVIVSARSSTVLLQHERKTVALGTILTADGIIVTKASQAAKADLVVLADGRTFPALVTGIDQTHDLALLKIDAVQLTPIRWSASDPRVGNWMVTVGVDPEPISIGVLSVTRREIPPGSEAGVLGIELERTDVPQIRRVYPNSGAETAGLVTGDIVLEVDQKEIATGDHLVKTIRRYRPGDTVLLKVRREKSDSEFSVTLTHPFGGFLSRIALQNQMGGELSDRRDDFSSAWQTDSVITPESCGGPVVGLDGTAIGVNIARAGRTETYVLPSDVVQATVQEIQSRTVNGQSVVTRKPPRPEPTPASEPVNRPATTP